MKSVVETVAATVSVTVIRTKHSEMIARRVYRFTKS